ncbi:MAG: type IX secretion system membrane protein PorP/SprF [Raineya sp.]|nr:type IX secretion system membrane protein PorP/SprF [Raineya sp.]
MKHFIRIYIFLFSLSNLVNAQGLPNTPFHLHNFNNYHLLNPAAAGLQPVFGSGEDPLFFFTFHRQQIGAFQNVPTYASLSFNKYIYKRGAPRLDEFGRQLRDKRGKPLYEEELTPNAIGGNVYNFTRSIWRTTGLWFSYAREVKVKFMESLFGVPVENLRLGIAMGAENDGFNIPDGTIDDPALVNRRDRFARPVGQVGLMYAFGGKSGPFSAWEFGAGLPRLFKPSSTYNYEGFFPLANWFVSLARQFSSDKLMFWSMKPMMIFRKFDNQTSTVEINNIFNYVNDKKHHWFGASWVKDYGFAVMAGTKFYYSKFGISYTFKFNDEKAGFNKNPVHEIQLIYNLRKLSSLDTAFINFEPPPQDSTIYDDDVAMEEIIIKDTVSEKNEDSVIVETEFPVHPEQISDEERQNLRQKFYRSYVVVGSFMIKENAERRQRELISRYKLNAKIRQSPINNFYEVYVMASDNFDKADKYALQLQKRFKDKTIWILCVPRKPDDLKEDE